MEKQTYKFSMALSMVVGIVIGSGIFFKADDILLAMNGNILYGMLGFIFVGLGVLFGAISASYYAMNDKEHTGIIGYARMALGDKFAYIVGWFSISCYFPAFVVVLAMVDSIYIGVLLGIDSQVFITIATLILIVATFTLNVKSPHVSGNLQIIFTVAKVIPLIVIGLIGTFFFSSSDSIAAIGTSTLEGGAPLSGLIAIAFAFDGWIVATNIARDLKAPERDLPRALALGSILIMIIYCVYFFGVTQIIDPQQIVELGDAHTEMAAQAILGPIGGKIITLFVIISVYGGLNGMTLAYLRLPEIFVDSGLMKSFKGNDADAKAKGALQFCALFVGGYFIFQQLLDYQLIFANLNNPFDLSSMPIMINYIFYIMLFIFVNKLVKNEAPKTRIFYLTMSLLATLTALIVVYGTMLTNGLLYLVFCLILTLAGIPFINKQTFKQN